ncbi:predicted protein [Histoplasma capsulatum H143]|uniref:Uncharacterized protein n=1 Tax=Ajellomyces capsulatus (strain H143) TaxID=544712 RepID=C6HGI9_AJECH|nr:predicted protein [Histoplasma capsulatum H143]
MPPGWDRVAAARFRRRAYGQYGGHYTAAESWHQPHPIPRAAKRQTQASAHALAATPVLIGCPYDTPVTAGNRPSCYRRTSAQRQEIGSRLQIVQSPRSDLGNYELPQICI